MFVSNIRFSGIFGPCTTEWSVLYTSFVLVGRQKSPLCTANQHHRLWKLSARQSHVHNFVQRLWRYVVSHVCQRRIWIENDADASAFHGVSHTWLLGDERPTSSRPITWQQRLNRQWLIKLDKTYNSQNCKVLLIYSYCYYYFCTSSINCITYIVICSNLPKHHLY